MAMIRRCQCWPRPRPIRAGSGPMFGMIDLLADRHRPQRSSIIPATGGASILWAICTVGEAFSRPMPMPAIMRCSMAIACRRRSSVLYAGAMRAAISSSWPILPRSSRSATKRPSSRRWQWRRSAGSTRSSTSSAPSTADLHRSALPFGRSTAHRWLPIWKNGCATTGQSYRRTAMWPRPWITCSRHGLHLPPSSTMAASA